MTEVVRDDLAQNHWFGKIVPVGQIMHAFVKDERGMILNRYAILGKRADHSPRPWFYSGFFFVTKGFFMDTNFSVIVWRYLISSYKDAPDENGETQLAK